MSYSSPFAKGQRPFTPRRPSTSSGRPNTSSGLSSSLTRPSTSSGEAIEPTSSFLREALREAKGIPPRARSTTPRRVRAALRSQSYKDEWLQSSSGDEKEPKERSQQRPSRPRRASEITTSSMSSHIHTMGARETESKIDRMEKENWNLKHRIMLFEDRAKKLNAQREEDAKSLKQAQEAIEHLSKEIALSEQQLEAAKENNAELTQINEELVQQLEKRDDEVESLEKDAVERQSAIEEAAGIIQSLEQRLGDIEIHTAAPQQSSPNRGDSDYFSADAEPPHSEKSSLSKPPGLSHSIDSDYFSTDTSPLVTPKTIKRMPATIEQNSPKLKAVEQQSVAFNRNLGIRSSLSKDSLFSSYLDSPKLPHKSEPSSRLLKLKNLRKKMQLPRSLKSADSPTMKAKPFPADIPEDTRELRNLYATGELGVQVNSNGKPIPPKRGSLSSSEGSHFSNSPDHNRHEEKSRSTPSIVVDSSPMEADPRLSSSTSGQPHPRSIHHRANSTNTRPSISLGRHNTTPVRTSQRPSPPRASSESRRRGSIAPGTGSLGLSPRSAARAGQQRASTVSPSLGHSRGQSSNSGLAMSSTYATPPAQSAPTYSTTKPTTRTHRSPPMPNMAMWPRRYPAWPPSAGLVNRDLLFHGAGMDEMFSQEEQNGEDHGRHW
ncbi:hypothetical protein BT63DRAFT_408363 [Microthyrium microscopicum]|uniref:Centrosomin N-terminal motif 1 domain-containing protein n=1 Tax=Microthyrium microscopicum TaxID=703497 RepID=A0A6A6UPH7_9PEZI|nr:hypothetical protein BT63DRAFT_408363 [Microthyrium microscopicum]